MVLLMVMLITIMVLVTMGECEHGDVEDEGDDGGGYASLSRKRCVF